MAVDSVQVNSAVGLDGNSYTTAISNDKLTNNDFLKLLLEEMKMQDPTKPMDSQKMMNSQLQMSTIEANVNMTNSMTALQQAFANSSLSNSANMIGHLVEDGSISDSGIANAFAISAVEKQGDDIFLAGYAVKEIDETTGNPILSTDKTMININNVTKIN